MAQSSFCVMETVIEVQVYQYVVVVPFVSEERVTVTGVSYGSWRVCHKFHQPRDASHETVRPNSPQNGGEPGIRREQLSRPGGFLGPPRKLPFEILQML
ncbi:hypothetical protein ON010_g7876 [Phytophthora cinnamomi]|nr:hypothetical protein ON010_g7876 [Phytophthora cinnamomi]